MPGLLKWGVCALVLFAGSHAAAAAPAKRVALVVGNANYSDISPLRKPLRDADRIADVLVGFGYDVIVGKDTKKQQLELLVQQFREKLVNADVGFFFYSGHGFQTNRVDQAHPVNHIVPVDFDLPDGDGQLKTVALDPIVQSLRSSVRVGFIFMDACRNDPRLTEASQRVDNGPKGVSIARGFSPVTGLIDLSSPIRPTVKGPAGLLIAYATDPGNVALEGEQGPLSPFTGALVKHIGAPGLTVAEIMGRVSDDVANGTGGQQTPWSVLSRTVGAYQFVARPDRITPTKTTTSSPARPSAPRAPAGRPPAFQAQ